MALQELPEPGSLTIGTDGAMRGRTRGYDKRLSDMPGLYRDAAAFDAAAEHGEDHLAPPVEEHRLDGASALVIGRSTWTGYRRGGR